MRAVFNHICLNKSKMRGKRKGIVEENRKKREGEEERSFCAYRKNVEMEKIRNAVQRIKLRFGSRSTHWYNYEVRESWGMFTARARVRELRPGVLIFYHSSLYIFNVYTELRS